MNFSLINSSTSNMYLRMSFSCFLFSQFGLLLPLIEEHLNLCQKSMMELFAKIVKARAIFSYFNKRKMLFISSKWHFSRYSFFCIFFPFVYHNLVQKNRLGSTWKNQVNFIKVFDNSLSKYLIFKSFWYELVVLGYFTKIKKWSGTRFYCTFCKLFLEKYFLLNTLSMDQVLLSDVVCFPRYQTMCLNSCLANWCYKLQDLSSVTFPSNSWQKKKRRQEGNFKKLISWERKKAF